MIILITILFFLSGLEHYTFFDWYINDFGDDVLRKIQRSTFNCRVENRPLITTAVLLPFIDSPIIETLARILTPHFLHAEAIEITQSIMSTLHKMSFAHFSSIPLFSQPFYSQDLVSNSPYCPPYNSCDAS